MPTIQELEDALINADAAGDTEGAMFLASEIKSMRQNAPVEVAQQQVKQREGVMNNADGSHSTHMMRTEYSPETGWVGFPSLFQNEDKTWYDLSQSQDWNEPYQEALKRGEVYSFGGDKDKALRFGEGSWKNQLPQQQEAPQPVEERSFMDNIEGGLNTALDTALMGGNDDIQGHLGAIIGKGKQLFNDDDSTYEELRQASQKYTQDSSKDFAQANPWTNAGVQGATMGLTAAKTIPEQISKAGAGALTRLFDTSKVGAAYGAMSGAGQSDGEDLLEDTAKGALTGAALPVLASGIGKAGGALAGKVLAKKPIPQASLKDQANEAYKSVDDLGVSIKPDSFEKISDDIIDGAKELTYHKKLHPRIKVALDEFSDTAAKGKGVTLKELDQLRRITSIAGQDFNNPDQQRIASKLVDQIDDIVENLKPSSTTGGNPVIAGKAYAKARSLWKANKKSELLKEAFDKAKRQASGEENGMRIAARSLLNNKKKISAFNQQEQNLIRKLEKGDLTGNVLRQLGKFGINPNGASNMLGAVMGAGGGAAIGGPVGAIVVPLVGSLAKRGALKSTQKKAAQLSELVENQGIQKQIKTPSNEAQKIISGTGILTGVNDD